VRCNHSSFRHAAAFEYQGPASTLTRQFKYSGRVHLAEAMAGYMAVQFFRVDWPLPDLIVPVPLSFSHFMTRGYNQSQLLAEQLGKILNRPVASVLKRRSGDFSQSGLDKQLRQKLLSHSFSLKKKTDLSDKIILLIDDVATTKTTLSHCVSLLQDAYPAKIYALTFCIA
jgi:ComF family protein